MTDNRWADVHAQLSSLFDEPGYAGYKPAVRESANGDGVVDTGKRFLHIAAKYYPPDWAIDYLARAHWEACKIAERICVPDAYYPRVEDGTLRVLEYTSAAHTWEPRTSGGPVCSRCGGNERDPLANEACPLLADSGTAEHTDMDLFTVNLWRSTPKDHEQYVTKWAPGTKRDPAWTRGAPAWHLGELGEIVGLGRAVPHRVPARPYAQKALVYFSLPSLTATLPAAGHGAARLGTAGRGNVTVGEWLAERKKRSRT